MGSKRLAPGDQIWTTPSGDECYVRDLATAQIHTNIASLNEYAEKWYDQMGDENRLPTELRDYISTAVSWIEVFHQEIHERELYKRVNEIPVTVCKEMDGTQYNVTGPSYNQLIEVAFGGR